MIKFIKKSIITSVSLLVALSPLTPAKAENLEQTQQLLATKQCQSCDLSGAGLVLANLVGANLSNANLVGANLSRANLTGADLRGANLTGASLFGANLTGANLTGANLNGTDLRSSYLTNAMLDVQSLNNAQLVGVVGLSASSGSAEDFYRFGVTEAKAGNYVNAIDFYNQALRLDSNLAAAYFARSMARADLGDLGSAIADAKQAQQLYKTLNSPEGEQLSLQLVEVLEYRQNPEQNKPRGGFLGMLESAAPMLLKLLF
ncbi:TPR domain protein [Planktothrix serta PCC 8927]|uniref:TPR domain protein n=1 Tax=Planktothrix serta PCC 8927 TaxID=671068 RepID=A0A7Z9E1U3_9CYAN|nr:TPR domain protein [Planktothrix serta PCC 8927]